MINNPLFFSPTGQCLLVISINNFNFPNRPISSISELVNKQFYKALIKRKIFHFLGEALSFSAHTDQCFPGIFMETLIFQPA
jgi:hypothetical protein